VRGWRTSRKIVVFESDDWGSIRMHSADDFKDLVIKGFKLDGHYNRYDSLERASDLSSLFEVLYANRDAKGNYPSITANFLVANPDFDRIKTGNFSEYFYENFTETYKNQKGCENSFSIVQQGIDNKIFRPQFHGREHLNVRLWMRAIHSRHEETMIGFDHKFWGIIPAFPDTKHRHFLSAYDIQSEDELSALNAIISDGLKTFETAFGYKSKSFIATNYTWHPGIEKTLFEHGVRYIQGQHKQLVPKVSETGYHKKRHYLGQKNELGQVYLVRNALFEPSENPAFDWVSSCMKDISNAFTWKKPAVICTHRVNFAGAIDPGNSARNLILFNKLLRKIIKSWPDVEFMTSDRLGAIIVKDEI